MQSPWRLLRHRWCACWTKPVRRRSRYWPRSSRPTRKACSAPSHRCRSKARVAGGVVWAVGGREQNGPENQRVAARTRSAYQQRLNGVAASNCAPLLKGPLLPFATLFNSPMAGQEEAEGALLFVLRRKRVQWSIASHEQSRPPSGAARFPSQAVLATSRASACPSRTGDSASNSGDSSATPGGSSTMTVEP